MAVFALQRVLWMLPVMLGVTTLTFAIMHFVPGGPWDQERKLSPQVVENLNHRYGLDRPLWEQYWSFVSNAVQGDLGVSYARPGRSVADVIRQGLPASAILGAFGFAVCLGVPLGMAAALRRNTLIDHFSVLAATLFASIPGFILGIFLIVIFAVNWSLLPTGGWGSPSQVVLPAIALGALPMAFIARITRASILEVVGQDYVRAARARGLPSLLVQRRHVLRNALIPILTVLGPELAALVAGSAIVETVFSVPGVGGLFVDAVRGRDYGIIMGLVLFYATLIVLVNLVVDILYAAADPRVRYA